MALSLILFPTVSCLPYWKNKSIVIDKPNSENFSNECEYASTESLD